MYVSIYVFSCKRKIEIELYTIVRIFTMLSRVSDIIAHIAMVQKGQPLSRIHCMACFLGTRHRPPLSDHSPILNSSCMCLFHIPQPHLLQRTWGALQTVLLDMSVWRTAAQLERFFSLIGRTTKNWMKSAVGT
jgi:hypothetical protein